MTPGFEVLGLDVERSVRFVEGLGWTLVGVVSEAGMSICGVELVVSGAFRRAVREEETSDLFSSLSSSELGVLIVNFLLFELCKDSPATLLSVASVSVRKLPSSSLSMASRYSLRFRVGILDGAPPTVYLFVEARADVYVPFAGEIRDWSGVLGFGDQALRLQPQHCSLKLRVSCTTFLLWRRYPHCF